MEVMAEFRHVLQGLKGFDKGGISIRRRATYNEITARVGEGGREGNDEEM
jgi:hypothetical protein